MRRDREEADIRVEPNARRRSPKLRSFYNLRTIAGRKLFSSAHLVHPLLMHAFHGVVHFFALLDQFIDHGAGPIELLVGRCLVHFVGQTPQVGILTLHEIAHLLMIFPRLPVQTVVTEMALRRGGLRLGSLG